VQLFSYERRSINALIQNMVDAYAIDPEIYESLWRRVRMDGECRSLFWPGMG